MTKNKRDGDGSVIWAVPRPTEIARSQPSNANNERAFIQTPMSLVREIVQIPLKLVRPSGMKQARSTDFSVKDILPSMAEHGLLQPIWVRTRPLTPPDPELGPVVYELIFGERRTLAASQLGWTTISAEVRDDLSSLDIYLIHLEENDRRRQLTPLEQADAVERLMRPIEEDGFGITDTAEIAARLNISVSTVHQRMALARASTHVRSLYDQGKLYLGSLIAIASLHSQTAQDEAAEACLPDGDAEPYPVRRVQKLVQDRYHLRLAQAPFDQTFELAGIGPCTTCPKRAGSTEQQSLFSVDSDVTAPAEDERCTDAGCYVLKRKAWSRRIIEAARVDGIPVIEGSNGRELYAAGRFVASRGPEYIDLDERPSGGGGKTYREIVGAAAPVVAIAVDGDDRTHDLADKTLVRSLLAQSNALGAAAVAGPAVPPSPAPAPKGKAVEVTAPAAVPEKPGDPNSLQRRAEEEAGLECLADVVDKAERRVVNAKLWRFALRAVCLMAGEGLESIVDRRSLRAAKDKRPDAEIVIEQLDSLGESELRCLFVEICSSFQGLHPTDGADDHALVVAARFYGFDLEEATKRAMRRLKKPKADAAKKAAKPVEPAQAETKAEHACSVCKCDEKNRCKNTDDVACVWADQERTLCSVCAEIQAMAVEVVSDGLKSPTLSELATLVWVRLRDVGSDPDRNAARQTARDWPLLIESALKDAEARKKILRDAGGRYKAPTRTAEKPPTAGATPDDDVPTMREQIVAFFRQQPELSGTRKDLLNALKDVPAAGILKEIAAMTKDKLVVPGSGKEPIRLIAPTYEAVMEELEELKQAETRARFSNVFAVATPDLTTLQLKEQIARRLSGERALAAPVPVDPKKARR